MSGVTGAGPSVPPGTDPVLRFLGGCAIVLAALAAIVVAGVLIIGWTLTRDETPGRPEEAFLLGDEVSYWCFDLRPDDAGLATVIENINTSAESARDEALKNSPLRFLAFHKRGDELLKQFPLKLEFAVAPEAWSGRVTISQGTLRVRAMMKFFRWIVGRDVAANARPMVGGVAVTTLHDPKFHGEVAVAMVGNRILAAGKTERLARALETSGGPGIVLDPRIGPMHDAVRLDAEDGWAFTAGPSVASFDVADSDELRFKILAPAAAGEGASSPVQMALAVTQSFLPYFGEEAFRFDDGSPAARADGTWLVSGRITDLSRRLGAAMFRFSASRMEEASGRETPSAIPPPPSPQPSSDPRSDTPGAPKREGTPSPAR
jgi:hypothetical protein